MHLLLGAAGVLFASAVLAPLSAQYPQRFADLGSCPTLAGQIVRDCRVGYRTFGRLNEARDNAVLIPTWHGGRSETMTFLLGPEGWVDTTRYFAVLMDALGNGVSTSPSNSPTQAGADFPQITLEDMVAAEHRVVTGALGIRRLHAVLGWSMGGMQAIVWGARYPEAVERVISVAGTPRMASYDLYWVRSMMSLLTLAQRAAVPRDTLALRLAELWHTVATTPAHENTVSRDSMDLALAAEARTDWLVFDPDDNLLQLRAMAALDAPRLWHEGSTGGRPRMLLLFVPDDHVFTPEPFRHLARSSAADTVAFVSRCGHLAPLCETAEIGGLVRRYLEASTPRPRRG